MGDNMKRIANIVNTVVENIWDVDNIDCYTGVYDTVPVPIDLYSEVETGWRYIDGRFVKPDNLGDEGIDELSKAKGLAISTIKKVAHDMLINTDWYVIRKIEENIEIPDNIMTERMQIKKHVQQFEELVNLVTEVKDLFSETAKIMNFMEKERIT